MMITTKVSIAAVSDTHDLHRHLEPLSEVDILIHAGDWTVFSKSLRSTENFNAWLYEQPARSMPVLVPGNHEFYLEADDRRRDLTDNGIVLLGEAITIGTVKIWGSPVTPLYGGAFGKSSSADRQRHYDQIPADIDILVTHGPPYGILDATSENPTHMGCRVLLAAVQRIQPRLHIFGHVHGAYGQVRVGPTTFVNACVVASDGRLAFGPHYLELDSQPSVD